MDLRSKAANHRCCKQQQPVLSQSVRHGNRYGALGISRRKELGYQPLHFNSLSELMMRYKKAYEQWWHTLLGIKVGLPVPHSVLSQEKICWRFCNVKVPKSAGAWERKVQRPLDKFARNLSLIHI